MFIVYGQIHSVSESLFTLLSALFLSSITSNKEGLESNTESARTSMADAMLFMTSNGNSARVALINASETSVKRLIFF
jgi:predicted double-glycine peptidase